MKNKSSARSSLVKLKEICKERPLLSTGIGLSFLWWLILFIGQRRVELVCTPDDSLCNSGNTFWGDFSWSTMMAALSLPIAWAGILFVYAVVQIIRKKS